MKTETYPCLVGVCIFLLLVSVVGADEGIQSISGSWQGVAAKSGPRERVWLIEFEIDAIGSQPEKLSPLQWTFLKEFTPPGVSVLYLEKQLPLRELTGTLRYVAVNYPVPDNTGSDPQQARYEAHGGEIRAIGFIQPQTGRFVFNLANHATRGRHPQFDDRAIHGYFNAADQTILALPYSASMGPMLLDRPDQVDRARLAFFDPDGHGADRKAAEPDEASDARPSEQATPSERAGRGERSRRGGQAGPIDQAELSERAEQDGDATDFDARQAFIDLQEDKLSERYQELYKLTKEDVALTGTHLSPLEHPQWVHDLIKRYDRPIRDRTAEHRKRRPDREMSDRTLLKNWRILERDKLRAAQAVNRDQAKQAKDAANAQRKKALEQELLNRRGSITGPLSEDGKTFADPQAMTAWFEQIRALRPDLDPASETYLRDAAPTLFVLLTDEYFKPHFGKSYLDLNNGEAEAIRRTLRGYNKDVDFSPPGLRNGYPLYNAFERDQRRYYTALTYGLGQLNRYAQQSVQSISKQDAREPSTFALTVALAGLAHHHFKALSPRQRQAFGKSLAGVQTKLADQAALHRVKQTIERHREAPEYRIFLIDRFWPRHELLNRHVTKPGRAAADQALNDYRDRLAQEAVAALKPRLANLGRGVTAADSGYEIYTDLRRAIGDAVDRPIAQQFLQPLLDRRAKDLADALPELRKRLETIDTAKRVWENIELTLSLPGDRDTPAAEQLIAAGNLRTAAIDRAAFEAMYSKRELELMNDQGVIEVPAQYDPPTPDEIRLAMARELGQVWAGRTGPYSYRHGIKGITNVFVGGFIIDFKPVTVLATVAHEGGHAAHYTHRARAELEHGEKDWMANNPLGAVMVKVVRDHINNQVHESADEFVLTAQGWRSPTIRRRAIGQKMEFYQNMARNLERALPRYRFIYVKR